MKHLIKKTTILFSLLLFPACFEAPDFMPKSSNSTFSTTSGVEVEIPVQVSDDGVVAGDFNSNSQVPQSISVAEDSEIKGTTTTFPPGALAVNTVVSVQEGTNISDVSMRENLGLTDDVNIKQSGAPVVIRSSVPMDTKKPFTIAIPLPEGTSLGLDETDNEFYAVFFRAEFVNENKIKDGVIPTNQLTIKDGLAYFQTKYFGSYQAVEVDKPITKAVVVVAKQPIVSKNQSKITPMVLSEVNKIILNDSDLITFTGENIKPTITLAFNDSVLAELKEASDVSASFYMPKVDFGFHKVKISQNGTEEQLTLFALNDKTDYPLMTVEPAGICEGVKYYDASGTLRVGTKSCTTAEPTTTTTSTVESSSNLDSDGNGAADLADQAISSVSAQYAFGQQGSDIASASQITLPSNGDFFKVTGSTTIQSITATNSPGRRVMLYFTENILIKHNTSNFPILLDGAADYVAGAGDVFEFVELPDGWQEIMRRSHNTTDFYAHLDNTGIISPNHTYTPIQWATIMNDSQQEYAPNEMTFTPKTGGTYYFEIDMQVEAVNFVYSTNLYFKIRKQDNSVIYSVNCYIYQEGITDCSSYSTTKTLSKGDVLSFDFYLDDYNYTNIEITPKTSNTYIKIKKIE